MVADGMVYRNGKNFHKNTVEGILKNEFIRGFFIGGAKNTKMLNMKRLLARAFYPGTESFVEPVQKQIEKRFVCLYQSYQMWCLRLCNNSRDQRKRSISTTIVLAIKEL